MKSVLISIQPKWCELIESGKKMVEVRKTKPKLETPFKCYIYCTQGLLKDIGVIGNEMYQKRMKVIGEFVCDEICEYEAYKWRQGGFEGLNYKYNSDLSEKSCVSQDELMKYGNRNTLYGWGISNLVIYDKPKELSEFFQKCKSYDKDEWKSDDCLECENPCGNGGKLYLKRPPQSWCYVEDVTTS